MDSCHNADTSVLICPQDRIGDLARDEVQAYRIADQVAAEAN
jgi:hypothetical protein